MYKKNLIFSIFFSLIINCVNVTAQQFYENSLLFTIKDAILGLFMYSGQFNWNLVISIAVFIVFAYMFYDALYSFSPFSKIPAFLIAILLTIIALSTGFIKSIANFLVSITRIFGHWGTIVVLIIIVLIYLIWRLFIYFLSRHLRK